MKQGTKEWLAIRKGRISASKIPIIMGLSPYQTAYELWEEELGLKQKEKTYDKHLKKGLSIESKVVDSFKEKTGIEVVPDVVFHSDNNKFMASLDGISHDKQTIIEIKNNNVKYHALAKKCQIVQFHQCQMQWQMYCANVNTNYYISYRENYNPSLAQQEVDIAIVDLSRNDPYIREQIKFAVDFLRRIEDLDPPPLTDKDYIDDSSNQKLEKFIREYHECKELAKYYETQANSLRHDIILESKQSNVRGNGWKVTKYSVPGRVDYDKILCHHNIDIETCQDFMKPSTTAYRISVE